ncbi:MAG: hypothetical protein D3909_19440 [Candidatus Electrothrix sp. ATG1]|nr:hypothetical protein [Candidatus Electrothrix sp. ATG1]MCI5210048.1 hypothetical protein [Candidatus Electrothrix sp. ATG2]
MTGMQLTDLPCSFLAVDNEKFIIVVSNTLELTHYKLTAHSQWVKRSGRTVGVGFHIVYAPVDWRKLIEITAPESEKKLSEEDA